MRIATLALVVFPFALSLPNPASAGIFDVITKPVKSVGKAVGGVVKDVGRTAEKAAKGTAKAIGGAANGVGKAATTVGREIGHTAPKVVNTTGIVVSNAYRGAGTVAGLFPLTKQAKPLAMDLSRCARSTPGKIGEVAGAAAGVMTGPAGIAFAIGKGSATGCFAKDAYRAGEQESKSFQKNWSDFRNSVR